MVLFRLKYLVPFFVYTGVLAQNSYEIQKNTGKPIKIDGVLDEEVWQQAAEASSFQQYFPFDSVQAKYQTKFWMTYDDEYLYFAAKMENLNEDRDYVTTSLRRDYRGNIDAG